MPNCFASRTVFTCASAPGAQRLAASAPRASAASADRLGRLVMFLLPQGVFSHPPGVLFFPSGGEPKAGVPRVNRGPLARRLRGVADGRRTSRHPWLRRVNGSRLFAAPRPGCPRPMDLPTDLAPHPPADRFPALAVEALHLH